MRLGFGEERTDQAKLGSFSSVRDSHKLLRVPKFALFLALLGWCSVAVAQHDKPQVDPEQNDFTLGTSIVPRGHFQVESAFSYALSGISHEVRLGDTLVRVPVASSVELRAMLPAYVYQGDITRRSGLADGDIGARLRLRKTKKAAFALTFDSTVPSGSRRVAERRYQPQAVLSADFSLSGRTTLTLNAGVGRPTNNGHSFTQALATAEITSQLTPKLTTFFEVYGLNRVEAGGHSQKFAGAGLIYGLSDKTAVYGELATGLHNGQGGDRSYNLGVAHLF